MRARERLLKLERMAEATTATEMLPRMVDLPPVPRNIEEWNGMVRFMLRDSDGADLDSDFLEELRAFRAR